MSVETKILSRVHFGWTQIQRDKQVCGPPKLGGIRAVDAAQAEEAGGWVFVRGGSEV